MLVASLLFAGVSAAHSTAAFAAPEGEIETTAPASDPAPAPTSDPAPAPASEPAPAPAPAPASAPAPSALAAAEGIPTSTVSELFLQPASYGHGLSVTGTVTLDGPAFIMGAPIHLLVNGVVAGTGVLIYIGEGKFWSLIPAADPLPAGTHELVVSFPGSSSGIPGMQDALPSDSAPMTITIAQAATTTAITSAPASVPAFTPVDVAAQVTVDDVMRSGMSALNGSAALLADGAPVATAALAADGTVAFDDVVVPFGTTELSAAYLGDDSGNFAVSTSGASTIEVTELATDTELALSETRVRAGDPVTFTATVRNISEANLVDPRSGIEFLVDGEVVFTEVSADDPDAAPGDGSTQFAVTLTDTPLGQHDVTARFLPVPGFTASESEALSLQVEGIDTALTPKVSQLRGTLEHPAVVEVDVSALPPVSMTDLLSADASASAASVGAAALAAPLVPAADAPSTGPVLDGYVQAFFGDQPIGEPFPVENGAGSGPITGLGLGTHQVELRFTPATYGLFSSSATVVVTVDASPAPKPGPTPTPTPGPVPAPGGGGQAAGLAATGGADASAWGLAALGLLAGAGALLTIAGRRRHGA